MIHKNNCHYLLIHGCALELRITSNNYQNMV